MSKSFIPTAQSIQQNVEEGVGSALEPGHRYCELIGSLLYLANTTRPDIAQSVGVLSRYRGTPTTAHMQEGLRVVRYLKGTRDYALQLGESDVPIAGFVNADYAGDLDMRASTTGFVFQVYGGSVVWGSKKQTGTAVTTLSVRGLCVSLCVWYTYCVRYYPPRTRHYLVSSDGPLLKRRPLENHSSDLLGGGCD
jgi:hypothetical protein